MEFIINNKAVLEDFPVLPTNGVAKLSDAKHFIEANTVEMDEDEMRDKHIIPVWTCSNEPLISHNDFIETLYEQTQQVFRGEQILKPNIRVSHPIKGRIPEAKHKPAAMLEPWEETLYYERMMFVIEIPSIAEDVGGNQLSLTIGGVKAYNMDNIYGKRVQPDQQFKLFMGFKNRVCCNLCVWSDGLSTQVGIRSLSQLQEAASKLLESYNISQQLRLMRGLEEYSLTETEFAQVMGRSRMYRFLPEQAKAEIEPILMGDQQVSAVVRSYYSDNDFAREGDGSITLWKLYNLFTGVNKSSYIDQFLDRTVNANDLVQHFAQHKAGHVNSWFLG